MVNLDNYLAENNSSLLNNPKCSKYIHDMEIKDDGKGWSCDRCSTSHSFGERWLCKTDGCDSDICFECIAADGHVNTNNSKLSRQLSGDEKPDGDTNTMILNLNDNKKPDISPFALSMIIFKPTFLMVALILLSIYSFSATNASRFRVNLTECDASNYAAGASWPPATAPYYAHSFSDINAESSWYYNTDPCLGWVFNAKKGLCPMDAATVKVKMNSNTIWGGSYKEFLDEDPQGLAPSCDNNRRRVLKTSTNNDSPSYEITFRQCIDMDDKNGDEVFSRMTELNKANNVKVDTTMTKNWEVFQSSAVYGTNAAILGWIFFPISIIQLGPLLNFFEFKYATALSFVSLALSAMYTGLITNVYYALYESNLLKTTTEQWSSFFPGCTVKTEIITGAGPNMLIASLVLIALNTVLQLLVTYEQHVKAKAANEEEKGSLNVNVDNFKNEFDSVSTNSYGANRRPSL